MMLDPALLHDDICHVSAWDFRINGHIFVVNGAVPYIVIAFAVPDECAPVFFESPSDDFFIFGHYKHTFA